MIHFEVLLLVSTWEKEKPAILTFKKDNVKFNFECEAISKIQNVKTLLCVFRSHSCFPSKAKWSSLSYLPSNLL